MYIFWQWHGNQGFPYGPLSRSKLLTPQCTSLASHSSIWDPTEPVSKFTSKPINSSAQRGNTWQTSNSTFPRQRFRQFKQNRTSKFPKDDAKMYFREQHCRLWEQHPASCDLLYDMEMEWNRPRGSNNQARYWSLLFPCRLRKKMFAATTDSMSKWFSIDVDLIKRLIAPAKPTVFTWACYQPRVRDHAHCLNTSKLTIFMNFLITNLTWQTAMLLTRMILPFSVWPN